MSAVTLRKSTNSSKPPGGACCSTQLRRSVWSASTRDLREPLLKLAHKQQESVRKLVHWLDDEGETIEYGMYPVDYTSLHYVSSEFLKKYLIADQARVVELATFECKTEDDETAHHQFLADILANEQAILDELKKL